jgi:3-oxoadipate enol-lactonase
MKADIKGASIDYRDEGSGMPVIFIHAFPLDQRMWDEQVEALRDRYRVVTFDVRGLGNSTADEGERTMFEMASDGRELMKRLSIDRAVIVGLSMGGYIALAFYRDYPDSVRALVLANTRAAADTDEGRERRVKSAERAEREGASAIADDMTPVAFASATLETRPDLVRRMRAMIEANSSSGIAAAQRAMAGRKDSTDLVSKMDFPVLIIAGSDDKLTPVAEMESLSRLIPTARLEVIQSAGHLSNLEQPAEFNRLLKDFFESLED